MNHTCLRGCNKRMFRLSSPATLPSALLTEPMETSALGAWKQKSDFFFFFFSTACHRWWESLCNANIISHCVGLALQFALRAKQPGCGVIYQYGEKKTSLGLHWKAAWLAGPAARPAATGSAFTLLIPRSVQCCGLLINSVCECLSHCVCLLKRILLRGTGH